MRDGVFPPDVKIVDVIKANMMMSDIMLEENDRLIICGSVNVMDHANSTMAHMAQMSPALMMKMTTLFQVMFTKQPTAIN